MEDICVNTYLSIYLRRFQLQVRRRLQVRSGRVQVLEWSCDTSAHVCIIIAHLHISSAQMQIYATLLLTSACWCDTCVHLCETSAHLCILGHIYAYFYRFRPHKCPSWLHQCAIMHYMHHPCAFLKCSLWQQNCVNLIKDGAYERWIALMY